MSVIAYFKKLTWKQNFAKNISFLIEKEAPFKQNLELQKVYRYSKNSKDMYIVYANILIGVIGVDLIWMSSIEPLQELLVD